MVAVGTVDEISNRVEQKTQIRIQAIGDHEPLKAWLENHSNVEAVSERLGDISLTLITTDEDYEDKAADLLAEMIHAGYRITSFAGESKSLEDVFLHVTEGRVQ